ncbi:MAG: YggT family protein [Corynebacterium sp.]|nr:YggT family protein [Corynebacterium sp.]
MVVAVVILDILEIFSYILVARIVIEMIQSYSRQFRPPRWFIWIAELLFTITDPVVKAVRKVVPPLRMGNVSLDLSVLVIFFLIMILRMIIIGAYIHTVAQI